MVIIENRADGSKRVALSFPKTEEGSISRAKQQFKDECDINKIMSRFKKTGLLPQITAEPIYGDFGNGLDFTEMQNNIVRIKGIFERLPVELKRELNFDEGNLVNYVADDKNYDNCVKLGLRVKDDKIEAERVLAMKVKDEEYQAKKDKEFADKVKKANEANASA